MSVCSLSEDCFYEIFKYVSKDDTKTLYNCLFVNRLFCRIVTPILYKNPFSAVNDIKQNYCLIRTYLGCLDEKERNYLKEHLIEILEDFTTLFFDYAKYLENFPDLTFAIECWFVYQLGNLDEDLTYLHYDEYINQLDRNRKLMLQETLFHLFLQKMKYCKELNIQAKLFDTSLFDLQFFIDKISYYTDLSSLDLTITQEDLSVPKEELFYKFISLITKNCFMIQELKITTFYSNYNSIILRNLIKVLIQNQRKFKNIHLINPNFFFLNDIFKIIGSKKHSLTSINITNSVRNIDDDVFKTIASCESLERLEFNNCRGLSYRTSKILFKSSLRLNELILHNNTRTTLFDLPLIRKIGGSLNKLSLDKISDMALGIISRHCLNLKILKIVCRNLPSTSYQHFRNMKIEQLIIYCELNLFYKVQKLAENLPDSLKNFTVENYNDIFTSSDCNDYVIPDDLENFLDNCRVNLITLNFDLYLKNENLLKILYYVENRKSLKRLGIRSCSFWIVNDKACGLILNEIKENGAEIVKIRKKIREPLVM